MSDLGHTLRAQISAPNVQRTTATASAERHVGVRRCCAWGQFEVGSSHRTFVRSPRQAAHSGASALDRLSVALLFERPCQRYRLRTRSHPRDSVSGPRPRRTPTVVAMNLPADASAAVSSRVHRAARLQQLSRATLCRYVRPIALATVQSASARRTTVVRWRVALVERLPIRCHDPCRQSVGTARLITVVSAIAASIVQYSQSSTFR